MHPDPRRKAIARWLLLGVFMLVIQILLGGITRLTGSGLSITEWKPILGAIPPLNEQEWQVAFTKYQQFAQYRLINAHFNLHDFKQIFFWEWFHREWARFGLAGVFAIGFIYFLIKKYFDKDMIIPFVILFILGGLQGLIGWLMVRTGLNDTDIHVSHFALAIHFISALILLCYTLWFALQLLVPKKERLTDPSLYKLSMICIGLLFIQLVYGAFMAGLKAATSAATWPKINDNWIPENIEHYGNLHYQGLNQYFSNPLAVQFIHRSLAYLLLICLIAWTTKAFKATQMLQGSRLKTWMWWPAILVTVQVLLGIFTVLNANQMIPGHFGRFELLAESHQLIAMTLLMSLVANLYLIRKRAFI